MVAIQPNKKSLAAKVLRQIKYATIYGGTPTLQDIATTLEVSVPQVREALKRLRKLGHTIENHRDGIKAGVLIYVEEVSSAET